MNVLLVEDDSSVADSLAANLRLYGHQVEHVRTGSEAVAHPQRDLVLVDLGLPDLDGIEVCRRLRLASAVPIIVVSARSAESDRVLALHVGADDYLIKPFAMRELIARMEAVRRRYVPNSAADQPAEHDAADHSGPVRRHGQIMLDTRQRQVSVSGTPVGLTRKEFDLLNLLMADPGAVVRRSMIIETVWDGNWFGSTRTVDAHVSSLRRKLGAAVLIEAKRGVGFRLVSSGPASIRGPADRPRPARICH
jgi:two-component system response regulator RegX3